MEELTNFNALAGAGTKFEETVITIGEILGLTFERMGDITAFYAEKARSENWTTLQNCKHLFSEEMYTPEERVYVFGMITGHLMKAMYYDTGNAYFDPFVEILCDILGIENQIELCERFMSFLEASGKTGMVPQMREILDTKEFSDREKYVFMAFWHGDIFRTINKAILSGEIEK